MIHGETLYTNAIRNEGGAVSLVDGEPIQRKHPLTDAPMPWTYHRAYGCNTVIAAENLFTFRSGAAGFCDIRTGGTGNFGGFKSGCTSNLIAADGVLNAPDYTRTCTCPYQNQTSLAMVPSDDLESWTFHQFPLYSGEPSPIRRLGLNLGAPGDRSDKRGLLWLDYPSIGGPSPDPDVKVEGEAEYHRRDSRFVEAGSESPRWIHASYVEGLRSMTVRLVPEIPAEKRLEYPVMASEDDAEENDSQAVNLKSGDLELTKDRSEQTVGVRFRNLNLDANSNILSAHIQFTVDEAAEEETELAIVAEASDNASAFTAKKSNLSSRSKTLASIEWNPPAWNHPGKTEANQQTPDLKPLLDELFSRSGWKKGQAAAFLFTGTGKRVAKTFDGDAKAAPRLCVTYRPSRNWPETLLYTVELHFVEPNLAIKPGDRRFDVSLQGKRVLDNFDILKAANGSNKGIVRRFENVPVKGELRIEFHPIAGTPILSGVSAVKE